MTHYPLDVAAVPSTNEAQIATSYGALIHAMRQLVRDFGITQQHASRIQGRSVFTVAWLLKAKVQGSEDTGFEREQPVLK